MSKADVIISGAGLSGLCTGVLLSEAGLSVQILEAHDQAGGRIRSVTDPQTGGFIADLGPSWIWPAHQPVIRRWLDKLQLETFPQHDTGHTILDHGPERPAQAGFFPGQDGNERVAGGSQALVDALKSRLPAGALHTGTPVRAIRIEASAVSVTTGETPLEAKHVIVALPPRIATSTVQWESPLPRELSRVLSETPTWMAPHAKVAVVFERPFWREMGLSGRLVSRAGPLVEAHDHCGPDGAPAALWGFIGWPHQMRQEAGEDLERHIRDQFKRCFGENSPEPLAIHIEDWAENALIASPADLNGQMEHPSVRPEVLREAHFDGRLVFVGAETALQSPGLIEGAFDAAERAAAVIVS